MIILFICTFLMVAFKAFQQLNVVGGHYQLVIPFSFLMATTEVVIVLTLIQSPTYWAILPMGLGGSLGAMLSMFLHRRYVG